MYHIFRILLILWYGDVATIEIHSTISSRRVLSTRSGPFRLGNKQIKYPIGPEKSAMNPYECDHKAE